MFLWLLQSYPDTGNYMIAGYAVIFVMMFLYTLSIAVRRRSTIRELESYRDTED
jgi:CcmD family protein